MRATEHITSYQVDEPLTSVVSGDFTPLVVPPDLPSPRDSDVIISIEDPLG